MSSDRIKEKLERFILGLLSPIDFYAAYACKVSSQNDDGTLELRPEDERLADYSRVPVHLGIPDTTIKIQSGARVMLEFENGSRDAPYVSSFDVSTLTELNIHSGTDGVARKNDTVDIGKFSLSDTAFQWTPPGGGSPVTLANIVFEPGDGGASLTITAADDNGKGKIDSASDVVKAG